VLTAASYLRAVLAKLEENIDQSNVPLSEAEESRLAWLGLVLQPLNPELARVNKVSDLTRNGRSGALISYVYPNSPAAKAGLQPGDILLRLHVESEPKPVEVEVEQAGQSWFPMLWSRYNEIPERAFDRIPRPWPAAEDKFTRMLTDLGFGKKFTVEYFRGGKVHKADFAVTQSPPHYDTAPRYKSNSLGMTVRDLTYELRQYFHRSDDQPGVIISKIEPGSKASVAGLRPYEIITHVNDEPVMNVKDFETLTNQSGELRFEVKRWTRGRVVKAVVDAPVKTPETQPASQPATKPAQ
jgi:serine protease Do